MSDYTVICIWSINYIIFIHAQDGWGLNRKMETRKANVGTPEVVHLSLKLIWVDDKLQYLLLNRKLFTEQHTNWASGHVVVFFNKLQIVTYSFIQQGFLRGQVLTHFTGRLLIIIKRALSTPDTCFSRALINPRRKPCILLPLLCSPHSLSPSLLPLSFVAVLHLKCFWGKSEKKKDVWSKNLFG